MKYYGSLTEDEKNADLMLVTFRKDWADEFDAVGHQVFNKFVMSEFLERLETFRKSGSSFYFGTNEGWKAEEFALSDFRFTPLDARQYAAYMEMFTRPYFGVFPDFEE